MNRTSGIIEKARTFVADVRTELRKSAWPTRAELIESTVVIIISVLILGGFVGASDRILATVIKLLVR